MTRYVHIAPHAAPRARRAGQAGVVLIVALIALVAITLASVALVRSIDTGLTIAGNTAFKEATTAASDVATDVAVSWLKINSSPASTLHASAAAGFYANWLTGCDMTGNKTPSNKSDDVDWAASGAASCGAKAVSASGMPSGYSASYVITRMCTCDGAPAATCGGGRDNICAGMAGKGRTHFTVDYAYRGLKSEEASRVATGSPYYRIITRVVGPRNTTSFVETVVTLE